MAYTESTRAITGVAGSSVSALRFVVRASDGQYDHAGTAQIPVDGISAEGASLNGEFPVVVPDGAVMKITAGAAITSGALVATNNAGKAIAFVDAAGNVATGRALTAATADGEVISIQFFHAKTGAGS